MEHFGDGRMNQTRARATKESKTTPTPGWPAEDIFMISVVPTELLWLTVGFVMLMACMLAASQAE
jgi:hypothetical protein